MEEKRRIVNYEVKLRRELHGQLNKRKERKICVGKEIWKNEEGRMRKEQEKA
jgi:hypothetical protein